MHFDSNKHSPWIKGQCVIKLIIKLILKLYGRLYCGAFGTALQPWQGSRRSTHEQVYIGANIVTEAGYYPKRTVSSYREIEKWTRDARGNCNCRKIPHRTHGIGNEPPPAGFYASNCTFVGGLWGCICRQSLRGVRSAAE